MSRNTPDPIDMQHQGNEIHLIREIVRTYQVLVSALSRQIGMTASKFTLMRILAISERDVGIMDLARQLGVNPAAVTRQVQVLESERLVRRRPDPRDKRRSYISLSPKGQRIFQEIHTRSHELEESLSSILSIEQMVVATGVLTKLRRFVEGLH